MLKKNCVNYLQIPENCQGSCHCQHLTTAIIPTARMVSSGWFLSPRLHKGLVSLGAGDILPILFLFPIQKKKLFWKDVTGN
jgi:hypothetical protein